LILLERKLGVCEIKWLLNGCLDRNIKIGEGRLRGRIRHRTVVYNMQPRGKVGSFPPVQCRRKCKRLEEFA
jgi:hypothetical protein